jgi:hypothetical protein
MSLKSRRQQKGGMESKLNPAFLTKPYIFQSAALPERNEVRIPIPCIYKDGWAFRTAKAQSYQAKCKTPHYVAQKYKTHQRMLP